MTVFGPHLPRSKRVEEPITFGFQAGAVELTGPSGGYHLLLPGFMSVMVAPDLSYLSYGFTSEGFGFQGSGGFRHVGEYFYTVPCDGILQAYCIILHLIKKHNRLEFLPAHLTIDSNNQEGEVE
jgi:hypothetical protein